MATTWQILLMALQNFNFVSPSGNNYNVLF